MADWTDLISMALIDAEIRADKYDHSLAVAFVGDEPVKSRPASTRNRPCVLVTVSSPFKGCRVTAVNGVEEASRVPSKDSEASLQSA